MIRCIRMYIIAYVKTHKKWFIISYVKPTARDGNVNTIQGSFLASSMQYFLNISEVRNIAGRYALYIWRES